MLSLTAKALLLLWPFLKRAIFGDRTVREVMLENKHVTFMFAMVLVLAMSLMLTIGELNDVKSENWKLKQRPECVCDVDSVESLQARRKLLGEILK
ncbi:hypothetical protein [Pseudomonas phage PA1C]|nr:hypothetical protein [Pseudomonas phage PA1C]BEG72428.1 hypothetical protein RVBP21_0560 [Pseudomonas phage BRkr]